MNTLFFRKINMNSLSASRFHIEYTIFFRKFTIFSWFNYLFIICFAILLGIHHLLREFTIFFANSPWIHFFGQITMIYYLLRVSLWKHYPSREVTICIAISLWIHYLFREYILNSFFRPNHYDTLSASPFTMNTLSFSRIHYLLREFTLNPLSFLRNHY